MGTLKKVIFAVLLAYVANTVFNIYCIFDYGKVIFYHEPGPCHLVPGVDEGSEDIQVLRNGIALVTSGLRLPMPGNEHTKHRKGRIFKFDFNNPEGGVEEVKIEHGGAISDMNPHGISIWEDKKTGQIRVFVVNHPIQENVDYICIFEYDVKSNTLRHLKSVNHPLFRLQNDVVATGPDSFYTTVYSASRGNAFVLFAEMMFQLHLGQVVYFDGKDGKIVETGLLTANGINVSPDGRYLYVVSSVDRNLKIYKRNADNGISFIREIALNTMGDNVNIDPENGDLWIGAHPIGHELTKHGQNPAEGAPSQVLRIRIQGNTDFIEEVFAEPSLRLFGSTVAERYKDAMLVGSIQHKLLYCQLKHVSQ